jgi:hypothetical protein
VATGIHGGDVWYNGLNSAGTALTATDSGAVTLTGTTALSSGQFYPH